MSEKKEPFYKLTSDQKERFQCMVLLHQMETSSRSYSVLLGLAEGGDPNDDDLEPLFARMHAKDMVEIVGESRYVVAKKGKEALAKFRERYTMCLRLHDVFCSVDLLTTEFGFAKMNEMDPDEFKAYIDNDRFADVRIAVIDYKENMDPVEVLFMTYLSERRFDLEGQTWQFALTHDYIWDDILNTLNEDLLGWEELGEDEEDSIEIIETIIEEGTKLVKRLLEEQEAKIAADEIANTQDDDEDEEEEVLETIMTVEIVDHDIGYYDPFLDDPYYVGPIWIDPLYDPYYGW